MIKTTQKIVCNFCGSGAETGTLFMGIGAHDYDTAAICRACVLDAAKIEAQGTVKMPAALAYERTQQVNYNNAAMAQAQNVFGY